MGVGLRGSGLLLSRLRLCPPPPPPFFVSSSLPNDALPTGLHDGRRANHRDGKVGHHKDQEHMPDTADRVHQGIGLPALEDGALGQQPLLDALAHGGEAALDQLERPF